MYIHTISYRLDSFRNAHVENWERPQKSMSHELLPMLLKTRRMWILSKDFNISQTRM